MGHVHITVLLVSKTNFPAMFHHTVIVIALQLT